MRQLVVAAAVLASAAAAACGAALGEEPADDARSALTAPFGDPIPGLDADLRARFDRGKLVAARRFAPSSGLGPLYNGIACASCHEKPTLGGGASRYRTVFAGAEAKDTFTVPFEHHFTTSSVAHDRRGPKTTTRTPPPFFGMGLLAEISMEEIVAHADPNDVDGDGIHGRVNFERGFVGRFGRKAQLSSLQGFVRLALHEHMGVTTDGVETPFLHHGDLPAELPTRDDDGVADPELVASDVADLVAFVAFLAPPPPDAPTAETRAGESIFRGIGCASCHVPSLRGPRGPVFAYTDLLLHDMGPALADGVAVGEATASEFRTQPLWGLGAAGPYLHDGRADTIEDAIGAHGGEAAASASRFAALSGSDRAALVAFLRSLGGSDRKSDGLLARDAPVLPPGRIGAPHADLSAGDLARFARGRDLFDHDFRGHEGLGSRFNGDACRSCHFDPVIGGSGPSDVDVIRSGVLAADGSFSPPLGGDTFTPRFDLLSGRPAADPAANLFERRQTPALFGLGDADDVPAEAITARADPDDRDGDGVRGVASVLADGRIGRFGWKAQAATLGDFVRDAFDHELGLAAGEVPASDVDDVVFFVHELAPPPGRATDLGPFTRMGCDACHAPSLPGKGGKPVPLFSDLLLHDVAPPDARFVVQGSARLFRTPPLWGVGATAPYLHDGSAETLDAAVRRHDGEAARARDRYVGASDADRAALLDFLRVL